MRVTFALQFLFEARELLRDESPVGFGNKGGVPSQIFPEFSGNAGSQAAIGLRERPLQTHLYESGTYLFSFHLRTFSVAYVHIGRHFSRGLRRLRNQGNEKCMATVGRGCYESPID